MEAIKKNSDIAVLTLETAVPLTSSVRPICLPSLSDTSNTYEGETGTVAGWGLTEDGQESVGQLLEVEVPIISNTQCKTFYQWLKRYFPIHLNKKYLPDIFQYSPLYSQARIKHRSLQGRLRWSSVY